MKKLIALIDKAPNRTRYNEYFDFEFEHFHMSSVPVTKLLKKDVDLDIDTDLYDLVICVGAEAAKEYAKVTSVTNFQGVLVDGKFVCISNPAMLGFKPEGRPAFEKAVAKIKDYVSGKVIDSSASGDFKGISEVEEAKSFLKEVIANANQYVFMDTEGTALYPRDGYVLGISLSYRQGHGRYVLTDVLDYECMSLLQYICDNFEIVFHNMKYDIKMLTYHLDLKFSKVHDTMLLHYVLDENDGHGLKPLALKHTNYGDYDKDLEEFKEGYCKRHGVLKEDFTYDLIPFEVICVYASIDTAVTLELFHKFYPVVCNNPKLLSVYENLLVPGTLFLMNMEEVGIPINSERMRGAEAYLDLKIEEAKRIVYSFDVVKKFEEDNGGIFNPGSPMQLRKILFDYLGLSPSKKTATGADSTDAEVLEELSLEHPLPAAILQVRQLTKIRNTYISKILPELDRDERIRTNFNLIFTTSGRLSSSGKFNAQQIPRDDPIVKGCICAPDGYSIVSQDLTTAEMYYAAVLSGDENLQAVFTSGGDFHSSIAKMVFSLPCPVDDVKALYGSKRQAAKAISFGIMYGSGPKKVTESVNKGLDANEERYTLEQAKEDISAYFKKFKKLKNWLNSRKEFIEANGFTYSFFGRKRRLPNVFSQDKGIASHEVRSGINAEIQSLASDMNLLGAMDTADEVKRLGLDAHIFMLVHDSIVALVKDECVEQYCEILARNTQKDRGCSIPKCPIGIDQEIGKDYSFGKFEKRYRLEQNILSSIQADS